MNRVISVWGRPFNLKITYDVYSDEDVLDKQKEAADRFLSKADTLLVDTKMIEKYCLERDGDRIGDSIPNIFKYVIPVSLFIKRDDIKRVVLLLCNYRFDEEHGIAIVFENERLKKIISQDDI